MLLLSGCFAAVALNATLVALFSLAALYTLVLLQEERWVRRVRSLVIHGLGTFGTYLFIMGIEWVVFGDPLIELKTIQNWHLKSIEEQKGYFAILLDPSSREYLFGFGLSIIRTEPLFTLIAIMLALYCCLDYQRSSAKFGCFLLAAASAYFSLEIFGPLAIQKYYLRFTVIPLALLMLFLVASAATRLTSSRPTLYFIPGFVVICLALWMYGAEGRQALRDDPPVDLYRQPIKLIEEHFSLHHSDRVSSDGIWSPDEVNIITASGSLPALIPYNIAIRVYTNYHSLENHVVLPVHSAATPRARLKYFISTNPEEQIILEGLGFSRLHYRIEKPPAWPAVYVLDSAEYQSF